MYITICEILIFGGLLGAFIFDKRIARAERRFGRWLISLFKICKMKSHESSNQ